MRLENTFVVPLPPEETWVLLNDVERVAPCLPGAELLEARDDRTYVGKVSVRLGPVLLGFKGTVSYIEVNSDDLSVRATAKGQEQKGRGAASADVQFRIAQDPEGSLVSIETDLNLAGSIAQYARGGTIVQTAAQLIIDEFAKNLKAELQAAPRKPGDAVKSAAPVSATKLSWMVVKDLVGGGGRGS